MSNPLGCCVLVATSAALAEPIDVWCDVDVGTGIGDVDDGLMLIQCFHSPELTVRGVSCVFGNAPLLWGFPKAKEICGRFGPKGLPVVPGAAQAGNFERETPAVAALAEALSERRLTILAVGPLTNVAALLTQHPELRDRIGHVVVVAGRREGQRFATGDLQKTPHRDFNFELDPEAARVVIGSAVGITFAGWEVSSHVWITRDDLVRLEKAGPSGRWIAESSGYWISRWEKGIDRRGFNPFDTLAAGWLTHPELIESVPVSERIEDGPDDRVSPATEPIPTKPYLHVRPIDAETEPPRVYLTRPKPAFKAVLLSRLGSDPRRPTEPLP